MKKNTILKTLGVGALALTGIFTFTGCSSDAKYQEQIQLLQTQNKQLEEEVTLLETENDSLEIGNAELEEDNETLTTENATLKTENDSLKTQKEELEEENAQLEQQIKELKCQKENVYKLITNAYTQFKSNTNGARDNLKITAKTYYASNGSIYLDESILLCNSATKGYLAGRQGESDTNKLFYRDPAGDCIYNEAGDYYYTGPTRRIYFNSNTYNKELDDFLLGCLNLTNVNLKLENIVDAKINANGNYEVFCYPNGQEASYNYYMLEMTEDGKFVKEEYRTNEWVTKYEFVYATVTEDDFTTLSTEAKKGILAGGHISLGYITINSATAGSGKTFRDVVKSFSLGITYYDAYGKLQTKLYQDLDSFLLDGGYVSGYSSATAGTFQCYFGMNDSKRLEKSGTVAYTIYPAE